jgi:hypothetical protein
MTRRTFAVFVILCSAGLQACRPGGPKGPYYTKLFAPGGRGITAAEDSAAKVAMPVFEVDASWPRLPNNWVMGDPSSIAVDRHDNVWILHRPRTVPAEKKDHAAPPVLEFDKHGKFLQSWGGPSEQLEWPDTEHGIYVDYKDRGQQPERADQSLVEIRRHAAQVHEQGQTHQADRAARPEPGE